MDRFAVSVFPVAKPDEWRQFVRESVGDGERAEGHRETLRRLGITCEHIYFQSSPGGGGLMVLVWEGLGQDEAAARFGELIGNPQSEHERYLVTHVIPELHGVDPTAGPPPQTEPVARIDTA